MSINQRDEQALVVIASVKIVEITNGLPRLFTSSYGQRILVKWRLNEIDRFHAMKHKYLLLLPHRET